jgi:hypothetical protein
VTCKVAAKVALVARIVDQDAGSRMPSAASFLAPPPPVGLGPLCATLKWIGGAAQPSRRASSVRPRLPDHVVLLIAVLDFSRVHDDDERRSAARGGRLRDDVRRRQGEVGPRSTGTSPRCSVAPVWPQPRLLDPDGDPTLRHPAFAYCVTPVDGGTCGAVDEATVATTPLRADPCTVTVTLTYGSTCSRRCTSSLREGSASIDDHDRP